jgi:hypothetical protein
MRNSNTTQHIHEQPYDPWVEFFLECHRICELAEQRAADEQQAVSAEPAEAEDPPVRRAA